MSLSKEISLQFVPFQSAIENGFWSKLADLKLNIYKLDDSRKEIRGFYTNTDVEGLPCRHTVAYSAFEEDGIPPKLCFLSHGSLYVKNTTEEFKNCDHKKLLQNEVNFIWDAIVSGEAITKPHLLVRFLLISYADLKKFVFHYWFAYPAFVHNTPLNVDSCNNNLLCEAKSNAFMDELQLSVDRYCQLHSCPPGFFIISLVNSQEGDSLKMNIHDLEEFEHIFEQGYKIMFGFSDPSTLENYPGWPLRNFLTLICYHWADKLNGVIEIICYRDKTVSGVRTVKHSLYLKVKAKSLTEKPSDCSGWEKNKRNKLGPRCVNLADSMDPLKLAESSVDLNLKLMRWRLMPTLQLEKIAQTKCLLLGSGTLGCNVARSLLAWGINTITLVDNGKVSFSNPVRQTLFEFSDCALGGGRPKALAAAERLKKIFPSVNATGVELSVPMPGHCIQKNAVLQTKSTVDKLQELISTHDVIYLLMDTRESRWLPTLLAAVKGKPVINVALGFDSYLVVRHGLINEPSASNISTKLGCYFCNDVVAPGNSMHDRTMDQQCTVTRPGVSMIASALAVELMVSLLQHPLGFYAPAESESSENMPFGPVPHQIRGFLSQSKVFYPYTDAFSKCTGCSQHVIDAYHEKNFDFLMDVFNSSHHFLEDLTGLTLLHQQTANAEGDILEFSDSESI